jgi:ethanolamine utilization protein EutN
MILARVEGSIVATKKHDKIMGRKILLVRPLVIDSPDGELRDGKSTLAAFDDLGAGEGEVVLIVQGSSARLGARDKETPVDAMVIGIVDSVSLKSRRHIYQANE